MGPIIKVLLLFTCLILLFGGYYSITLSQSAEPGENALPESAMPTNYVQKMFAELKQQLDQSNVEIADLRQQLKQSKDEVAKLKETVKQMPQFGMSPNDVQKMLGSESVRKSAAWGKEWNNDHGRGKDWDRGDPNSPLVEKFITVERMHLEYLAQLIVAQTPSGGMVSYSRKLATVSNSMSVLIDAIPGDFVETGCNAGGTSILMAKVLDGYDPSGRVLWSADSFEGLPDEDASVELTLNRPKTQGAGQFFDSKTSKRGEMSTTRQQFEANVKRNSLEHMLKSGRMKILQGFFKETLPPAPIKAISYLRLDGDLYISTIQALEALYDKVSIGGYIYVDDYGSYKGCRMAVDEYRKKYSITEPLIPVWEYRSHVLDGFFEAAVWIKRAATKTPVAAA